MAEWIYPINHGIKFSFGKGHIFWDRGGDGVFDITKYSVLNSAVEKLWYQLLFPII